MIAVRVVLDANLVVSAAINPTGLPRTVFVACVTKPASLFVSEAILAEYTGVLARRELRIPRGLQQRFLQEIRSRAGLVRTIRQLRVALDLDDDKFLECADAARADYLVTGNTRHFPKFWKCTKVVTPKEFVELLAPHLVAGF